MKYTRYDMKKKSRHGTLLLSILFLFIFLLGIVVLNAFARNYKASFSPLKQSKNESDAVKIKEDHGIIKFVALQGGLYENKNNAEDCKNVFLNYGNPFSIEEEKRTRVFLGIYSEEEAEQAIKKLNENKIDNSKMIFQMQRSDLCNAEIIEILNAHLKIMCKLSEKEVKGIQTEELKKWTEKLSEVDKGSKNIGVLNELKNYVKNLPKEITKEKAAESYMFLYALLKKVNL